MPAPYNVTNITGSESITDFFVAVNSLTDSAMVPVIIIAIGVVVFVALKNYESKVAIAASIYGTTVLAIILNSFVEVPTIMMIFLFVFSAATTAFLFVDRGFGA